jgi:hypothetical protein
MVGTTNLRVVFMVGKRTIKYFLLKVSITASFTALLV